MKKTVAVSLFMIMFFTAISDSLRGLFMPIFKQSFLLSNSSLALITSTSYLGYLVFTYIGGMVISIVGQKTIIKLGLWIAAVSFFIMSFSKSFVLFILGMFFSTGAIALLSISINTLAPVIFAAYASVLMNLMHFFYGLGSTLTQAEAGRLIYYGYSYNKLYLFMSILSIILIIYITMNKIPKTSNKRTISSKAIFKGWRIYTFILIIGFYSVAEHGTLNWFSSYLINGLKFNYLKSSQLLASFFALLTLGRLLGGMLVEKLGKYNSILIFLCTASILYLLGVFIGERGAILISISGLFFSIVFPTLILIIGESFKDNYEYATGIIIGSATCFDIIFNTIIGLLNDKIGYQYTFFIMPFSLVISALGIYILMTHKSSK